MSVLFFDGFDRYTVIKKLDPNHWSYQPGQPLEYEKYAFGGYSYNHAVNNYPSLSIYTEGYGDGYYSTYSPNNGILPTGKHMSNPGYNYGSIGSGNGYPGFGAPPGFLALSNLPITDANNLVPTTYVQLSGFAQPQGESSFLTTRFLGLETKDTNYATSDKPGRFGSKHPLVAFCSGNHTGLILNVVKHTGNHIELLENEPMTMALEVEQAEGVSGYLDFNINNDLNNYRVRSVFGGDFGGTYDNSNLNEENNGSGLAGRILTIDADHQRYQFSNPVGNDKISPTSRWCHLQFGIVGTGTVPYLQVKLDDVDLLSIPADDTIIDKDDWEDKIYISGFNYDNIRFFNRTYNDSLQFRETRSYQTYGYSPVVTVGLGLDSLYYMKGSVTLIDDVILSDNTAPTTTFLGKNAKVVPFTPGLDGYTDDGGGLPEGYISGIQEWSSNVGSTRLAFKNLDGDTGRVTSNTSGTIASVPYRPYSKNYGTPDLQSISALGHVEDAIGGIKFYTQAKKEFLDTRYVPVAYTGTADPLQTGIHIMLNFDRDNPLISSTRPYRTYQPPVGSYEPWKFGLSGNLSTDSKIGDGSLVLYSGDFLQSVPLDSAVHMIYQHPELYLPGQSYSNGNWTNVQWAEEFTLECWIKFSGLNDTLTIFSKDYLNLPAGQRLVGSSTTDPKVVRSHGSYNISVNTGALTYVRYSHSNTSNDSVSNNNTGVLELYYPTPITDTDWHHIALNNTATGLVVFLDGVSGTSYGLDLSNINGEYDLLNGFDEYGQDWVQNANSRTGTNELFYWGVARDLAKNFTAGSNPGWTNSKQHPLKIYGNGYIDGFRVTKPSVRYTENFIPPLEMKGERDNYIEIGDIQTLTKTRYGRIYQFYQYENPADNQPWATGWVNHPSGFILGVKKL